MSRKTEVIIAVAIILALVIVLFMLLRKPDAQDDAIDVAQDTTGGEEVEIPEVDPADIPSNQEVSATAVSRSFVERFGSYSTESGYGNIDDVLSLVTSGLAARLEDLAEDAREDEADSYYGVSTRVMTTKTLSVTDTAADFLMTTQREESFDTPGNTSVRYQDIRLSLVKEGEDWLVSDFTWVE